MDRSLWNLHSIFKIEFQNLFVYGNFLIFGIFQENCDFHVVFLFSKFLKNRSQKLSMLERKQGQCWNLHWIPNKVMKRHFKFSFIFCLIYFSLLFFFWPHQNNMLKIKKSLHNFVQNSMQISILAFFSSSIDSFWLLFFWKSTNTFYEKKNKYIYNVQLPYSSPLIPFGLPITVFSSRNASFTYLSILF